MDEKPSDLKINLEELKKISDAFQEQMKMLSKIPKETFENFAKIQEEFRRAFKPFTNAWIEHAKKAEQFMVYTKETIKEVGEILSSLGWWIYPDWSIPGDVRQL